MTTSSKTISEVEKWVDIIRKWREVDPYPPIRPLVERIVEAIAQAREEAYELGMKDEAECREDMWERAMQIKKEQTGLEK